MEGRLCILVAFLGLRKLLLYAVDAIDTVDEEDENENEGDLDFVQ